MIWAPGQNLLYLKPRLTRRGGGGGGGGGFSSLVIDQGPMAKGGPFLMSKRMYYNERKNLVQIMLNDKFGSIIINNWSFIITLHWVPNGFITIMGACYHFITAMVAIYRYGFITAMGTIYGFFTAIGAHTFFFWSWPRNFSRRPWWEVGRGRKNNKSCSRQ